MRIKILSLLIILLTFKFAFGYDFEQIQTPFRYVHKVKFLENNLMIVSGDSAYVDLTTFNPFIQYVGGGFYKSTDMGVKYQGPYMDGNTLLDISVSKLKSDRLFAIGAKFGRTGIYESNDKGNTWSFMPKYEETSIMHKIITVSDGGSESVFIANLNASDGLIISQTNFENVFKPNTIQSQVFDIKYSVQLKRFFLASDHNEHGRVIQYSGLGTIKDISGLEKLRVLSVQPSTINPAYIYAGADSITFAKVAVGKGIYMSIDTGKTWKYLTGGGMRVFDIQEHPSETNYIAAAMGSGGVGISSNYGQYFEVYRGGLPKDAEVRSVAIPNIQIDALGIIVYPVTLEHGVFKSRPLTSSIQNSSYSKDFRIELISPNPASSYVNIQYYISESSEVELLIINNIGQILHSSVLGYARDGFNSLSINDLILPNGAYQLILKTNKQVVSQNLIISK